MLRPCSGPRSGKSESGIYPIAPLSRSSAMFPTPLREVSAALWSAQLSLDLSSSILAVIPINRGRSPATILYKVKIKCNFFRSTEYFAYRVCLKAVRRIQPPPAVPAAYVEAQRASPPTTQVPAAASRAIYQR